MFTSFRQKSFKKIIIAALLLLLLIFSTLSLREFPVGLFEDDTYFYYTIANNFAKLGYPTFDGLAATNGFHHLWLHILALISFLLKILGVKSNFLIGLTFNLITTIIIFLLIREYKNEFVKILGLAVSFLSGFGMEAFLGSLIVVLLIKSFLKDKSSPVNGVLYAMLSLCRIDYILHALPLALASPSRNKKIIIATCLGFGSCLVLFLNYLYADSFLSVSSLIKAGSLADGRITLLNAINNASSNVLSLGNAIRLSIILLLVLLIVVKLKSLVVINESNSLFTFKIVPAGEKSGIVVVLLSSTSFLLFHLFFGQLRDWYFASTTFSLLYIYDFIYAGERDLRRKFADSILLILAASVTALFIAYYILYSDPRAATSVFIDQSISLLPRGANVYVYDGSGFLGWRLNDFNISVINGDGLVNTLEYLKISKRSCPEFIDYVKINKINYFITNDGAVNPLNLGNPDQHLAADCTAKAFQSFKLAGSEANTRYLRYQLYEIRPRA